MEAGWLLQEADDVSPDEIDFRPVTEKTPTQQQIEDAKFAWLCVKHVKSNAIVVAKVTYLYAHTQHSKSLPISLVMKTFFISYY